MKSPFDGPAGCCPSVLPLAILALRWITVCRPRDTLVKPAARVTWCCPRPLADARIGVRIESATSERMREYLKFYIDGACVDPVDWTDSAARSMIQPRPQGAEPMTFGAKSTTDEVLDGVDLTGKRVLVTGVSAGLGVETARALAAHGADVVGAARDLGKAKQATDAAGVAKDGGSLELIELDLAYLASVRAAPTRWSRTAEPFDLVIANAGVMATPVRPHRRRLRDPVRHQPPRPLRVRQPHRLADEGRRAAGEPVVGRPPLLRREPRRPELRAHGV